MPYCLSDKNYKKNIKVHCCNIKNYDENWKGIINDLIIPDIYQGRFLDRRYDELLFIYSRIVEMTIW